MNTAARTANIVSAPLVGAPISVNGLPASLMPPKISTPTPTSPRRPSRGITMYVAPASASTEVNCAFFFAPVIVLT